MGLGRLYAEVENDRNFLAAFAFGKQLNDLTLARSQTLLGDFAGVAAAIEEAVEHHLGDTRREECGSALQGLDSGDEVAGRVGFQEKAARADFQNFANDLF